MFHSHSQSLLFDVTSFFYKVNSFRWTYHCKVAIEITCKAKAQLKNAIPYVSRNSDLIYVEEYYLSSVFDCNTIVALPKIRNAIAGRSYFQLKVSFRKHIANTALIMIAEAEFAVSIVMSANGNTP